MDFADVRDITRHKKPLIKTAVVYGPNASGKSNLGFAIFDIVQHLVDKMTQADAYSYYLNADTPESPAEFTYTFFGLFWTFGEMRVPRAAGPSTETN